MRRVRRGPARAGGGELSPFLRDGVTRTGYAVYATWGWFLYGFGALLPQLGIDQGISRAVTGLHSVALASGGLIAGVLAVPLVRSMRRRGVFVLGSTLIIAGVIALTAGAAWTPVTLTAVLAAGTGGALLVNTVAPTLSDHHGTAGPAALAEGNAVAAGTGLVAPLVVGAGIALGLSWRPAVLLTLPIVLIVLLLLRRQPAGIPALDGADTDRSAPRRALPGAVRPLLLLVMLCVGVEFCMSAWTADLLRQRAGLSPGAAAAGVSAVIAGMTAGRLLAGRLALRHSPQRLLVLALVITLAGWAVVWAATSPVPAMAGLAVTGLGIAAHYPMGSALVLGGTPIEQRDQAAGAMSVGVALAAGGGPFALGAIADASDTHTAFLVVPVLLVIALALLLTAGRARPPA